MKVPPKGIAVLGGMASARALSTLSRRERLNTDLAATFARILLNAHAAETRPNRI